MGAVTFSVWSLTIATGEAHVQEVFGLSPKAIGMGNAFTSIADDFSACYYNPAGLGQHAGHKLYIGYVLSQPRLKQYLFSSPDVPHAVETVSFRSMLFGAVVDLAKLFHTRNRRFVLGVAATAGDNFKAAWRIHDWNPEVPRFIRNGDYMNRAHVFSGIGYELLKDRLFVGAAINLWETINVERLEMTVELSGRIESKEADVNGDFDCAPIVGVLFRPYQWVSFACVYRGEMAQDDPTRLKASSVLGKITIPIELFMPLRDYFLPWNITCGGSVHPVDNLRLSCDATFYRWSDFSLPMWKGRYPQWNDTVVPRFGCDYRIIDTLTVRAGYYYEPTPVPDQSRTRSNYLDCTKHVISCGAGYTFEELPFIGRLPFRYPVALDAFFQYHVMEPRTQHKLETTGQDGWRIRGYQFSVGVGLSLCF